MPISFLIPADRFLLSCAEVFTFADSKTSAKKEGIYTDKIQTLS